LWLGFFETTVSPRMGVDCFEWLKDKLTILEGP
jgi:hypothetical protein